MYKNKIFLLFVINISIIHSSFLAMDKKIEIKDNSWSNWSNKRILTAAIVAIGGITLFGKNHNDGYGNTIIGTNNSITGNGNTVIGIANNIHGHGNTVIGVKNNILNYNGSTIIDITAVSFLIGIGMALFYSSKNVLQVL